MGSSMSDSARPPWRPSWCAKPKEYRSCRGALRLKALRVTMLIAPPIELAGRSGVGGLGDFDAFDQRERGLEEIERAIRAGRVVVGELHAIHLDGVQAGRD